MLNVKRSICDDDAFLRSFPDVNLNVSRSTISEGHLVLLASEMISPTDSGKAILEECRKANPMFSYRVKDGEKTRVGRAHFADIVWLDDHESDVSMGDPMNGWLCGLSVELPTTPCYIIL